VITPGPRKYHPQHDPEFVVDVVNDLIIHRGEWRHPGRVVAEARGGECDQFDLAHYTRRAIEVAKRRGFVIEGDTHRGYRWVGWRWDRNRKLGQMKDEWPEVREQRPPVRDRIRQRRPHTESPLPGQLTIMQAL